MDLEIDEILRGTKIIALVGASDKPLKDSNLSLRYLVSNGFHVIPINPVLREVEGIKTYPNLQSIPDEIEIDVVNIYRRPQFVEEILTDAILRCLDKKHKRPAIWTQFGVSSDAAQAKATEFGLPYIKNRCILVEHSRITS